MAGWRTHLGHEVLEAGDDICALELLVVAETASDDNHSDQRQGQVQLQSETHKGFMHSSEKPLPQGHCHSFRVPWCFGEFPPSTGKPRVLFLRPKPLSPCSINANSLALHLQCLVSMSLNHSPWLLISHVCIWSLFLVSWSTPASPKSCICRASSCFYVPCFIFPNPYATLCPCAHWSLCHCVSVPVSVLQTYAMIGISMSQMPSLCTSEYQCHVT